MAGPGDLLTAARLATLLRPFDDAAWEALANRGLLRRARKDLDGGALPVAVHGETAAGLAITVGPFTVVIPETGPARATCSCPAPGVCQHILMAGLFLQRTAAADNNDPAEATPETGDAEPELLALEVEAIRRWAGLPEFRAALGLVGAETNGPEIETVPGGLLRVRFHGPGAECRFVPGGGLDGAIVTGGNPRHAKRLVAAAVLALQRARGRELPAELLVTAAAETALPETAGAPRDRAEILRAARALLCESVAVGLAHLGPGVGERLTTLSISAVGANLPRLSLALRALADETRALDARAARADAGRFLSGLARTFALVEALGTNDHGPNRAGLIGTHRSRYEETDTLELVGLGAYPWRTASGYRGLTVLFWDERRGEWFSWTDARPESQGIPFDPVARYGAELPWEGGLTPRQVSRARLRLRHARRNAAGRLGSTPRCRAVALGPTAWETVNLGDRLFTRWDRLRAHADAAAPLGLREARPTRELVVLRPARWGERDFDAVAQTFRWTTEDEAGALLTLELPFADGSAGAIRWLENLAAPAAGTAVLGRVGRRGHALTLRPLTWLQPALAEGEPGTIVHLELDHGKSAAGVGNAAPPLAPAGEEGDEGNELPTGLLAQPGGDAGLDGTALDVALGRLEERLETLAEAGGRSNRSGLENAGADLRALGLGTLAGAVENVVRTADPAALLRCRYVCELHRQAATRVAG